MEQFTIYLWSISENLQLFLILCGSCLLIAFPIIRVSIAEECDEDFPKKSIVSFMVTGFIMLCLVPLIPSKRDLALMFAYPYIKSGAQAVAKSETMSKLQIISSKYLDKIIADLEQGGYDKK